MSDPIEQTKVLLRLTEILSLLGVEVQKASFCGDWHYRYELTVSVHDLSVKALIRAESETSQSPDNRPEG